MQLAKGECGSPVRLSECRRMICEQIHRATHYGPKGLTHDVNLGTTEDVHAGWLAGAHRDARARAHTHMQVYHHRSAGETWVRVVCVCVCVCAPIPYLPETPTSVPHICQSATIARSPGKVCEDALYPGPRMPHTPQPWSCHTHATTNQSRRVTEDAPAFEALKHEGPVEVLIQATNNTFGVSGGHAMHPKGHARPSQLTHAMHTWSRAVMAFMWAILSFFVLDRPQEKYKRCS